MDLTLGQWKDLTIEEAKRKLRSRTEVHRHCEALAKKNIHCFEGSQRT